MPADQNTGLSFRNIKLVFHVVNRLTVAEGTAKSFFVLYSSLASSLSLLKLMSHNKINTLKRGVDNEIDFFAANGIR